MATSMVLDQIAIIGALHRWLEWDHPGAEDDYRTGAAFINEALATVRDGAKRVQLDNSGMNKDSYHDQ